MLAEKRSSKKLRKCVCKFIKEIRNQFCTTLRHWRNQISSGKSRTSNSSFFHTQVRLWMQFTTGKDFFITCFYKTRFSKPRLESCNKWHWQTSTRSREISSLWTNTFLRNLSSRNWSKTPFGINNYTIKRKKKMFLSQK